MLDLGWWMTDWQEFRNDKLFITLRTARYIIPGNDKYHIMFDLRDEILTPDHPNANANVWRTASRNTKFKIIYFSFRIFILGTPPYPIPNPNPTSHPLPWVFLRVSNLRNQGPNWMVACLHHEMLGARGGGTVPYNVSPFVSLQCYCTSTE